MLEMRNFLQKKINKKGFTLAELLVVVAIIAILVAVSIPIFTGKLNEAKKNTDLANVRAAKAAAVTSFLQADTKTNTYEMAYDAENGKMIAKASANTIEGYNQTVQKTIDPKGAVIVVKITEPTSGGDTVVETDWVAGKSN